MKNTSNAIGLLDIIVHLAAVVTIVAAVAVA